MIASRCSIGLKSQACRSYYEQQKFSAPGAIRKGWFWVKHRQRCIWVNPQPLNSKGGQDLSLRLRDIGYGSLRLKRTPKRRSRLASRDICCNGWLFF
jgi:hypothetical protein